ncbi:MAG: hypothetical protein IPJ82_20660 [Lewinellaceae bacterium]|nr:hypothetical protein [Lewinellaceae bacterium]
MSDQERNMLLDELEILIILLDVHLQNPDFWRDDPKGFDEYVNSVLDRMNEIKKQLNEPPAL